MVSNMKTVNHVALPLFLLLLPYVVLGQTCGGTTSDTSGTFDSANGDCTTTLDTGAGDFFRLTAEYFDVTSTDCPTCSVSVTPMDGTTEQYCTGNMPSQYLIKSTSVEVVVVATDATCNMVINWEAVAYSDACCPSIDFSFDAGSSAAAMAVASEYEGCYNYDSDGVYKLDTADANGATPWLAWIGNNSCSNPWTLSSDKYASPGSDLGWAFLSGDNAMCPEDLTMMETLDTTLVISATDTAPTITCKNTCTGPPPEPTDSTITSDFTGSWSDMAATYSVGMEVQYSCPDGGYKYARCEADGTWWTDDPDTCQYPAGVPAGCTEVASSSTYDEVTVSSGDCYIIKSHANWNSSDYSVEWGIEKWLFRLNSTESPRCKQLILKFQRQVFGISGTFDSTTGRCHDPADELKIWNSQDQGNAYYICGTAPPSWVIKMSKKGQGKKIRWRRRRDPGVTDKGFRIKVTCSTT